jgi:phage terminase Nu1 subunit (DNA packaging protein)
MNEDFEFEAERGMVVNKVKLAQLTGLSPMTIDKMFADGAPFISKGS